MKKAVGAILYHCTDFADQNSRHLFCPKTEDTWCKWQLDKLKGTTKYKNHISIPKRFHDIIDLASDKLLSKIQMNV